MRADWAAALILACTITLGGFAHARAEDQGPVVVAQQSNCELARDMWADVKTTTNQGVLRAFIAAASDCPVYAALAEERMDELGGAVPEPQPTPAPVQVAVPTSETECDRLAGYTFHPRQPGLAGIETAAMNAQAAIAACTEAVRTYPQESFFSLLLARAYQLVDTSDPRIESLVRAGMDGHRAFGLSRLGLIYANGYAGVTADPMQAADYARQSCDLGDATGCNNLGTNYANGAGVAKDHGRAVELYRQACVRGLDVGCNNLAHRYRDGQGVAQNLAEAARYFGIACEKGWADGCVQQAIIYGDDSNKWETYNQVPILIERACVLGSSASCVRASAHYWEGDRKPVDHARAVELLDRGCSLGSREACMELATNMEEIYNDTGGLNLAEPVVNGQFAGHDLPRAILRSFELACSDEFSSACTAVTLLKSGDLEQKLELRRRIRQTMSETVDALHD